MTHVLCALDLSNEGDAGNIFAEAEKLANLYGATMSVVTVVPDYGSSWVGSFFEEGTLKLATEKAMEALRDLTQAARDRGLTVQHVVEVGTVYEQTLAVADKCAADLIVVGAHKPDLSERIIGPNAARIARHATASVMVLRV